MTLAIVFMCVAFALGFVLGVSINSEMDRLDKERKK